jgi:hypothetical protein
MGLVALAGLVQARAQARAQERAALAARVRVLVALVEQARALVREAQRRP